MVPPDTGNTIRTSSDCSHGGKPHADVPSGRKNEWAEQMDSGPHYYECSPHRMSPHRGEIEGPTQCQVYEVSFPSLLMVFVV